jgi:hypothetical protein
MQIINSFCYSAYNILGSYCYQLFQELLVTLVWLIKLPFLAIKPDCIVLRNSVMGNNFEIPKILWVFLIVTGIKPPVTGVSGLLFCLVLSCRF